MSVCLSVCPSVTKTPQPLRIAPIDHQVYRPSGLSTIKPIDHQAYWPSSLSTIKPIDYQAYWPSSQLTLKPIESINHQAYRPSILSTIKPMDHWAHWPTSLLTYGLLSRLLSLSACWKTTLSLLFFIRKWNSVRASLSGYTSITVQGKCKSISFLFLMFSSKREQRK